MAQPLIPISITAPGIFGLNTEEAAASTDPRWALELTNSAFDINGRIAARNGWAFNTASGNRHSSDTEALFEYQKDASTSFIVTAADNKFYVAWDASVPDVTDLTDETGTNTPTDNHWQMVNYAGTVVAGQAGHIPQFWSGTTTNFADITTGSGPGAADANWGNSILSAWGRLWVTDDEERTIYWSGLLVAPNGGTLWSAGGSLDTAEIWPDGLDRIVALAEWQRRLVVFGTRSILIFTSNSPGTSGITDPASDMELEDVITASGCVARDSVVSIGTDLLYLARDGLRSLARGIQFSTMPLQQLSRPVRQSLVDDIQDTSDAADIKCAYSRRHALYIARIGVHYWAFDVRAPLERGELRASKWTGIGFKSIFMAEDGTLYLGQTNGLANYSTHQDNGGSYQWSYKSPWLLPAQGPVNILPKYGLATLDTTGAYVIGASWGTDFQDGDSLSVSLPPARTLAEWNIAEWGIGEWSGGGSQIQRIHFPMSRSGDRVQIGFSVNVDGSPFALIRVDLMAKRGRLAA